jgi:hypothetical protein
MQYCVGRKFIFRKVAAVFWRNEQIPPHMAANFIKFNPCNLPGSGIKFILE